MFKKSDLIVPLSDVSNDDKESFGEKAAHLGEMLKHGFPFPNGFVITPNAYRQFLLKYDVPETLAKEIFRAYKRLERPLKDAQVEVSLFLSSNNKNNSIIQKKEIVKGEAVLVQKIKAIWNSFLKNRDYLNINPSIIVTKIPQPSLSGVMYTTDPLNSDKTKIVIKEDKSGHHYEVFKKSLKMSSKNINKGKKQLLTDKKIIDVAALGKKLQEHYYFPQEVYFAIENNKIYITNIKPITTLKHEINHNQPKQFKHNNALLKGKPLYPGIATGHLRIIQSIQDINKILRGEIIVIPYQDLIKHPVVKAGAIVATEDRFRHVPHPTVGPFFSGKPTIITTSDNGNMLTNGTVVTVNGKNGEVYVGSKWQQ